MKTIFLLLFFGTLTINGQEFNTALDKDSIIQVHIQKVPKNKQKKFLRMYKKGNKAQKELFIIMLSFSKSSKTEQIQNLKENRKNIFNLIEEYLKLVPITHFVTIEFQPENIVLKMDKRIDIGIYKNLEGGNRSLEYRGRDLTYDSEVLKNKIKTIGWTEETLLNIKSLLDKANCISINNGEITTVGFSRSGMGKYSYKIFKFDLNEEQKTQYNDGCNYIYYERNIVLEFGGGAAGQECFNIE